MTDATGAFCVLPFVQLNTELRGAASPCCENLGNFGDPRTQGIDQSWNSPAWRALRRSFRGGERPPSCEYCWRMEDSGVRSYREDNNLWHGALGPDLDDPAIYDAGTGEMRVAPRLLVLKLSSLCNLACRMCVPAISTNVQKIWDTELVRMTTMPMSGLVRNYPDRVKLNRELEVIAPTLDQISFSGGEPFSDPHVVQVLETLKPWSDTIRLYVNTNLTKLQHGSIDLIGLMRQYKEKRICISVDGPPQLHAYIRPGLDIIAFERNLLALQEDGSFELHANIALQTLNTLQFPETMEYVLRVVRPQALVISIASGVDQEHTDSRALPPPLKAAALLRMQRYRETVQSYGWLSDAMRANAVEILDKAIGFVGSEDLHTPAIWQRTADYYAKLDAVHRTRMQAACPELAMFLPPSALAPQPAATSVQNAAE